MTELAVIGIDSLLADQHNIDRVERAFYQGAALAQSKLNHKLTLAELCITSVERMALANQLQISDIALVVVVETEISLSALDQKFSTYSVFSDLADALVESSRLIADKNISVALVGLNLVDKIQQTSEQKATISFDQSFNGYTSIEGVASVLLSSPKYASDNHATVYSQIKSFDANTNIETAIKTSLTQANLTAEQIGLLEVSALSDKKLSATERDALIKSYQGKEQLSTAISCVKSVVGESGGLSQVAGLLKCILALHQRYIPAITDWQTPSSLDDWLASAFYFPTEARPRFPNADGQAHTAAYSCLTENSYCHIVLQEPNLKDTRNNGFMACSDLFLFLIDGDSERALVSQLENIEENLEQNSLSDIANACFSKSQSNSDKPYHIALIAESKQDLLKEISQAKIGLGKAIENNVDWKTPKGSYFAAHSSDASDSVAFMYPGIGATYVGLGRDLFHLFPKIYQPVAGLADDIGASLKDRLLSPRSITRLGFKELKQLDLALRGNLADIAECGVGYACVFTKVFEEVFEVYADFSTGYSMGEVSMYAALGCWVQPGLMSARLAQSDTFNHRLCGELETLKEHWSLPADLDQSNGKIWETYTIKATLEQVNVAAADEDRVYCTIINTPDQLLLGGYPEACERVIKKLGVRAMALNMANAIHSAPAYKEYEHMEKLYTMDVTTRIKTKMYSSSCYLPIPQRSKAIANSIAKCLCDPVDFPRLVNTLYNQGARVFIEMGPGRSLSSWVDKILKDEEGLSENRKTSENASSRRESHVSIPVNAKGTNDELTYVRALAKLYCHGVKVNLDSLFNGSIVVNK